MSPFQAVVTGRCECKRQNPRQQWETQVTLANLEDRGRELGDEGTLNRLEKAENQILPRSLQTGAGPH